MLRTLIDPSQAPINFTPSNEAAAGRLARDNQVVFIDGVTRLNRRPAEVLARLSTGLPVNFHGEQQNLSRPVVITTNEAGAVERLSSRVLTVELPALPNPLPQDELHRRFEAMRPALVGALCTLLSTALRRLPGMPLPEASRFPEAAQWAAAALDTIDEKELFCVTQSDLVNLIFESNGEWTGTASELKAALNSSLTPRALSQSLSEISGICVTKTRTKDTRTLTLSCATGHRLSWPVDDATTVEAPQRSTDPCTTDDRFLSSVDDADPLETPQTTPDPITLKPSFASPASICGRPCRIDTRQSHTAVEQVT
jgi:hypothetical protein